MRWGAAVLRYSGYGIATGRVSGALAYTISTSIVALLVHCLGDHWK